MTCVRLHKVTGGRKHVGLIITQSTFQIRNLSEDQEKACEGGNRGGVDREDMKQRGWTELLKLRSPAHSNSKFRAAEN